MNIQSIFEPRGPQAEQITELGWVLIVGGAVIFVVVVALTGYAILARAQRKQWLTGSGFVIGAGVVFPTIVLFALLVYTLIATSKLIRADAPAVRIEVIGEQWWWRVHYLDDGRARLRHSERNPRSRRALDRARRSKTADVIHSFWVPNLAGKLDMIPGRSESDELIVDRAGVFRGQCAEYCGGPHAQMALYVVAQARRRRSSNGARSSARRATPAKRATAAAASAYFCTRCAGCHAVRGTEAMGDRGPDLTHVGSRLSIAAGMLPTTSERSPAGSPTSQHIKPGNLMPSLTAFTARSCRRWRQYLESLK